MKEISLQLILLYYYVDTVDLVRIFSYDSGLDWVCIDFGRKTLRILLEIIYHYSLHRSMSLFLLALAIAVHQYDSTRIWRWLMFLLLAHGGGARMIM